MYKFKTEEFLRSSKIIFMYEKIPLTLELNIVSISPLSNLDSVHYLLTTLLAK